MTTTINTPMHVPWQVLQPLSVEDGTLTRTMKPRRPEIFKRYAKEVEELMQKLRG